MCEKSQSNHRFKFNVYDFFYLLNMFLGVHGVTKCTKLFLIRYTDSFIYLNKYHSFHYYIYVI